MLGVIVWYWDIECGVLFGLCSVLVFFCVVVFWLVSVWLSGLGVVLIIGVVLSFFVSCDNLV